MKVIFLDIDGVMNSFSGTIKRSGQALIGIFHEHEEILDWMLQRINAKIVVSSTWRYKYVDDPLSIRKEFSYKSIWSNIIGITPVMRESCRGDEIQAWIEDFEVTQNEEVTNFVILDDDSDMGTLMDHLVKTDGMEGLTYSKAYEALKFFLSQKEITGKCFLN